MDDIGRIDELMMFFWLPSQELTYPIQSHLGRWVSFAIGGICYVPWRVTWCRFKCHNFGSQLVSNLTLRILGTCRGASQRERRRTFPAERWWVGCGGTKRPMKSEQVVAFKKAHNKKTTTFLPALSIDLFFLLKRVLRVEQKLGRCHGDACSQWNLGEDVVLESLLWTSNHTFKCHQHLLRKLPPFKDCVVLLLGPIIRG